MNSVKVLFFGTLISLFLITNVTAQPEVGVLFGPNNSKLTGDGPPNGSYKYLLGYVFSLQTDFRLAENVKLSFQPGIRVGGAKVAFKDLDLEEYRDSLTIRTTSLIFPLFVKINSKSDRLYFFGGFSLDFPIRIRADNGVNKIDISDEINKMNLNAYFGIGYAIPLRTSRVFIELRYFQGLVNLSNQKDEDEAYLPRVKTSGMNLVLGWQLPLRKERYP